jgi:hypothetical protein
MRAGFVAEAVALPDDAFDWLRPGVIQIIHHWSSWSHIGIGCK